MRTYIITILIGMNDGTTKEIDLKRFAYNRGVCVREIKPKLNAMINSGSIRTFRLI